MFIIRLTMTVYVSLDKLTWHWVTSTLQ